MSELDSIKSKPKAKRILKNVTFPKGSHYAYTSEDQGFAASGKNQAYLFKAAKASKITPNERKLLLEMGYQESDLEKSKSDTSASTEANLNPNEIETKGNKMSDEIVKALEAEIKQIKLERKLEKAASKYSFENSDELAVALAKLSEDDQTVIFKCFDTLAEKITAEAQAKEEAIQKAAAANANPGADNEIRKALAEEQGEGGAAPTPTTDALTERKAILKAAIDKAYEKTGVKN